MEASIREIARRYASAAFDTASQRGYKIPDEHKVYRDLIRDAGEIARRSSTPLPVTMPKTGTDLTAYIAEKARERVEEREAIAVASEVEDHTWRALANLAKSYAPTLATQIAEEFADNTERLVEMLATAPREVGAETAPEEFAKYQDLLRAMRAVALDISHRAGIASLLDEERAPWIWHYLAPSDDAMVYEVRELTNQFATSIPASPEDWERIARVGISMGGIGEAAARAEWWAGVQFRAGYTTADGGRLDKPIRDALDAPTGGRPWSQGRAVRRIAVLR